MDNQLLTLSKMFTERLFRIPDYQRGYAWTEKQLKDFWNDLEQLDSDHNHYTGVITLEEVPKPVWRHWEDDFWIIDAKKFQPYYVVDGQQRMTTAIILIQVIMENLPPGVKLNFTDLADIQRKFIFDSKDNGISRSYIFGYEKDNPSYEFLKTKIFRERSSSSLSQETVYTQNLAHAKEFFAQRVSALSQEDIEVLYRKVTQQLLFNIFSITQDVDVCVAFETMNNRGKRLSYLELLKNRLIYLSLKFDEPDYERTALRRAINDCWKSIYHNLGRNKDRPLDDDEFLLTHYGIYFTKTSDDGKTEAGGRLRQRLRDYASDLLENRFVSKNVTNHSPSDSKLSLSDVYQYVSSLQEAVETWYVMWNPLDSDFSHDVRMWLDKINRLENRSYHPLILVFLQSVRSESQRLAFLQALERRFFVLTITRASYSENYHNKAIELAADLRLGKTTPERVIKFLTDSTVQLMKSPDFDLVDRLGTGAYYWSALRYFLFEYNLDLQSKSKTVRPKIFWPEFTERKEDYVSVEHIFPQYARDRYWTSRFGHLSQKQRLSVRDSLGNLLPLSTPKNSSLSNKPFPLKVDGNSEQRVGYRYGCYAENEVAKEQEWTPHLVLKRGLTLLDFMERRWGIEIGNVDQRRAVLGLTFIQ